MNELEEKVMKIMELFDSPLEYTITPEKFNGGFTGSFVVRGDENQSIEYTVNISPTMPMSSIAIKTIGVDPMAEPDEFDKKVEIMPCYEIAFRIRNSENYDLTQTGNEVKVFATVLRIIADVVRQTTPLELQFDAKEPSRVKLYDRLVKQLSSQFGFIDVSDQPTRDGSKDYLLVNSTYVNK